MRQTIKTVISMAMIFVMLLCMGIAVSAENEILVFLNGEVLTFEDQNPTIVNDRTLVPFRGILEAMGATVDWDGATRTVTAKKDDTLIKLTIDDPVMYKNGEAVVLDVPAQIINDRTMVPARAVSESFNAKVEWDGTWRYVVISTDELLNQAVAIVNSAKDFYWSASAGFTYEGLPVEMGMAVGIDHVNKKVLNSFLINMGELGKEEVTVIMGENKMFFEENGVLSMEEEYEEWEETSTFEEGTIFLRESEANGEVTYQVIDGSGMKLVIDQKTAQPLRLMYSEEMLDELFGLQGGVYEGDLAGDILLDSGKLMEIWNQYEQRTASDQ